MFGRSCRRSYGCQGVTCTCFLGARSTRLAGQGSRPIRKSGRPLLAVGPWFCSGRPTQSRPREICMTSQNIIRKAFCSLQVCICSLPRNPQGLSEPEAARPIAKTVFGLWAASSSLHESLRRCVLINPAAPQRAGLHKSHSLLNLEEPLGVGVVGSTLLGGA